MKYKYKYRRKRKQNIPEVTESYLQDFVMSRSVQEAKEESVLARFEEAFRKFVSSHDNYIRFKDDEEKSELMVDSYENQRDMELQLETLVCEWRV